MFAKLKIFGGPLAGLMAALPALLILYQTPVWADSGTEALIRRLETLEKEVKELRALLKKQEQASATKKDVESVKEEVVKVSDVHSEWRDAKSVVHLAGYGDATFVAPDGEDSRFEASFNPIFHFMYEDLLMMESELEFEVNNEGETEVGLEYAALDLFLNDSATLVAGKFLNPIGQFRQNFHPSWINKLPDAPIGFGHDGAAPISDVGVQLRGGFLAGNTRMNYAAFVANGPELKADEHGNGDADADADGDENAEEPVAAALETGGVAQDVGDTKVFGGRFGVRPIPNLEVGASAGFGQVPVTGSGQIPGEPERDYRVLGVDAAFQHAGKLDLRAEWIQQKVDADAASAMFPNDMTWEAWYLQAAYKFPPTKFEGVVRYGEFDTPSSMQEQWAFGINYILANNIIAKLSYESNKGFPDRWLAQLAYGY